MPLAKRSWEEASATDIEAIVRARDGDPFRVLDLHRGAMRPATSASTRPMSLRLLSTIALLLRHDSR